MPAKPQRLGKQQLLDLWDSLDPEQPLRMTPIAADHEGTTYLQDTIRVTGSREWIESIMARLKGLLEYEGNGSRLEPMLTEVVERVRDENGKLGNGVNLTGSWAFYLKAKDRSTGRPRGRRKGSMNGPKMDAAPTPIKAPNPLREVNAGLRLKAKPKEEPASPTATKKILPTASDPVYAIASSFEDEEGNIDPIWQEPTEDHPILKCETYETHPDAAARIEKLRKDKNFAKAPMEIVEIGVKGKKFTYKQV